MPPPSSEGGLNYTRLETTLSVSESSLSVTLCVPPVSLRLGHGSALTVHRTVIHSLAAASLPGGRGLVRTSPLPGGGISLPFGGGVSCRLTEGGLCYSYFSFSHPVLLSSSRVIGVPRNARRKFWGARGRGSTKRTEKVLGVPVEGAFGTSASTFFPLFAFAFRQKCLLDHID